MVGEKNSLWMIEGGQVEAACLTTAESITVDIFTFFEENNERIFRGEVAARSVLAIHVEIFRGRKGSSGAAMAA